jgi:hypothetical protein
VSGPGLSGAPAYEQAGRTELGEWLPFEQDEILDADGGPLCPVEGCDASGTERIFLIGHEYTYGMPGGVGET